MILSIGEILFDIFPEYHRLGGAPFNFAFHVRQLGWPVRFVSRIGKDPEGEQILNLLVTQGFDTRFVQTDDHSRTGKVFVKTDNSGNPEFTILENVAYDHISFSDEISKMISEPLDLLYIGSLSQRSPGGFETVQQILRQKHLFTKVFYDMNLRPRCYSENIITESLKHTNILKLNEDELVVLKNIFGSTERNKAFFNRLFGEYPLEMVAVTKGDRGSELFLKERHIIQRVAAVIDIIDTVGAGDGFSAILAIGYLKKWEPEKILTVATVFAERICRLEGAVPARKEFYSDFKKLLLDR